MTEHEHQAALFRWARLASGARPELALMFAVPNGGARTARTGAMLKAEGVKAGVPDIFLPVPRDNWHGLFIELKTAKGCASAVQREWIARLQEQGYRAEVCRGWNTARELIEEYLQ